MFASPFTLRVRESLLQLGNVGNRTFWRDPTGLAHNMFPVLSRKKALGEASRVCRKRFYGKRSSVPWLGVSTTNKELSAVFRCDCIFWNPCLLERREWKI